MRYKSIIACASLGLLLVLDLSARQTLYRYEAFIPGKRPDNVTPADPGTSLLPAYGRLSRGPGGGAFAGTPYGMYRGDSAYSFEEFAGENDLQTGFSVEAFFRLTPEAQTGRCVIAGNEPSSGGSGWSLALEEGKPVGRFWTEGSGSSHSIHGDVALETGRWYRLVYRYRQENGQSLHEHDIWLDSAQVAYGSVNEANLRLSSPHAPVVGAARKASPAFGDWIHADVMAVQIHDYALSDYFLGIPLVRDGSPYFGIPDYHNYLGLDGVAGGAPLEQRLVETVFNPDGTGKYPGFAGLERDRRFLPLLNDGFVVQGMAGDVENRRLYLSMYHLTVDGVSYTYPSVVVEIDLENYQLRRVLVLHDEAGAPLQSHVGGIAYWDDLLFVPGPPRSSTMDPDIYVYDLSKVPPASFNPETLEGFAGIDLDATWKLRDPIGVLGESARFNSISFMGIHMNAAHELILHLGNFQSTTPAPVHLFRLDLADGQPPALTHVYTHIEAQRRTQSVHYYFEADITNRTAWKSFQATSYGNSDSVLYSYSYLSGREAPFGSEVMRMPAGLEEVFSVNEKLWLTSESGSLYYQKRTNPWTDFYPFLSCLDSGNWADPNGNGINEQWEAKFGLVGQQDPVSDLDGDGFNLVQEYFWDTDPRDAGSYPESTVAPDLAGIKLPTSPERFYTLQETSDLLTWITIDGVDHRRGRSALEVLSSAMPLTSRFFRVLVEDD